MTSSLVRSRSALASLVRTHTTPPLADLLLIVVRIVLAWIFLYYGAGKLFGAFNGPGLHATALFFSHTAHLHPGGFFAVLGGVIEFGGAIALIFGLGARLAGLALVGDMVMAMITVTWTNGINSESLTPGYELNLALAALALVVVVFGAGRFSVDAFLDRQLALSSRRAN